jgi:hypothetical protein
VVNGIENLFGSRSGNEKKNAAISFVQTALSMAGAIESREIVDEATFKTGLSMIIDGVVTCLNSSVWAKKPLAVGSELSAKPVQP